MMLKTTRYKFLIQQFKNKIYSYSLYLLKNKMDADDVTQEVMIRLWQNLDKFNALAVNSWIMKTTHNLCIDFLRKRKVNINREYVFDETLEQEYRSSNLDDDPLLKIHIKMMSSKIKEKIKKLPDNLKNVFILYELQGLKYKEISKVLNMPLNSVKVYLMRARKKLQEDLKNYELQKVI